ncbi:MAG: carboxypeptidase regulatory-like domain-containing protein [Acidobacteria bacterium]|nr:carboxypeptidase regulatory-like domain-containing protein [Acidobacteriota bacterium]
MRICSVLVLVVLAAWGEARAAPADDTLKLLISVEQQTVTAPYPIRATLHLHNSGPAPVWLYRPIRGPAGNGSTLDVQLTPSRELGAGADASPGHAAVFERAGFPRPRLVRLDSGADYEEKTNLKVVPAMTGAEGQGEPVWGRYRLTAVYRAQYSNASVVERIAGVDLWEGETAGNAVEIELQPPSGEGTISGRVLAKESRPIFDALVTLSDEQERLVDQIRTGFEGRYSFANLPWGIFWVTVRRMNFPEDTVQFRHLDVTPEVPDGTIDFLLLPREIHRAREFLHKPVLLRVTDNEGRPLDKVRMDITWSSGTVLETIKADVAADGTIALQLLPGRHYVTLKRGGCRKEEHRVDVAEGEGIDGFVLHYDCGAK